LFWSKPTPPPPAPPVVAPPPVIAPKKTRRWGLWLIVSVITLSMASAGCKDRRLLDGTGTSTSSTAKPTDKKPGSTTSSPIVTVATTATTQPPPPMLEYVIVSGDTVFGVAKKYGVTVTALLAANNLADGNRIQVGQKIKIPVAAAAATTAATATPNAAATPGATAAPGTATTKAPTGGVGTFPPLTVADGTTETSIVTITVVVNVPKTTVKP
jgi:LysM repeat protein